MSKELFVTSTPHETKLAVVEDDQLVEVFFERENEYTLAGSIYKGRVTRVLPGMQSAFVDIGLERDAFLYVTDFMEEVEDDDLETDTPKQSNDRGSERGRRHERQPRPQQNVTAPVESPSLQIDGDFTDSAEELPATEAATTETTGETAPAENAGSERGGTRRWRGRRGRRRGRGGVGGAKFEGQRGEAATPASAGTDESVQETEDEFGAEPEAEIEAVASESFNQTDEAPEAAEPEPETRSEARPEVRSEAPRKTQPSRAPERMVLPGESLARFNRKPEETSRTESASVSMPEPQVESRFTKTAPRPSTEVKDPAAFLSASHGVLAGETLAKYRNRPAPVEEPLAEQHQEIEAIQADSVAASMEEAETKIDEFPEVQQEEAIASPAAAERTASKHSAEPEAAEPEAAEPETQSETAESETEEKGSGHYNFRPGAGVIEEEEIFEEEQEIGHFGESVDDSEFAELEEETLESDEESQREADVIAAGEGLAAAFAESRRDEQSQSETYLQDEIEDEDEEEEGAEGEEEFAEGEHAEVLAEGEAITDPDDPNYSGRAELRGPSGAAGLQQRTIPGRGFDRKGRGGRNRRFSGKRPMRGGPRRNIPRGPLPQINDLLKEGQEILVQIAKEPMAKKGARITSHIALPGRFLVFMPTVNHTGVSRKIGSEEERMRLKRILISEKGQSHGGFIVRTAAAGASEEDLRADIRFLINLWNEIKGRSESGKAPSLIYHDLNLVERILRDQVTGTFSTIWVDTESEYERILRFASRFQPSLVKRVKLYSKETPLFEQFNITDEINKALKSKVWLKSGGYIVINQTEALVAIDINTGKYVGKTARLEDTIVKTNIDAIQEIVRQIRLRDLGGIIIIDFIDMDERKNRQKVMQALEEALKKDRSPSKVLQFNDFGLVAITRKRVKQSLERTLGTQCTYCTGTGMIKSVATVCNEIYVEMRKMAKHFEAGQVMLRVHPDVAKALKENSGKWLSEMEEMIKRTIIVKSDPAQHQEQFDIH